MLREMLHVGPMHVPHVGVLMLASLFRETMPWLYELGVEVFRLAKRGHSAELQAAVADFRNMVEFSVHGPMSREFMGRSKDMMMLMDEIDPLLERALGGLTADVVARPHADKKGLFPGKSVGG